MDRARRRFIQSLAPAAVAASLPGALRASALAEASREGQDPSSGGGALERSSGKGFAMTPQELEWKALRIQALLMEGYAGSTPAAMGLRPVDDSHQLQLFITDGLVKGIKNRAQKVRA